MDEEEAIVIDAGSASVKAGYSGEDTPRVVFPSTVQDDGADPLSAPEGQGGSRRPEAIEWHGGEGGSHNHPIQRGTVAEGDWDKMERLWDVTFGQELRTYPENATAHGGMPVLLTEPALNSKANRERMAQIMFETFKAPGLCIMNSASVSLFASGRTRGIVCECGAGVSHAVPVFEGFALLHAILRSEVAGQDVTAALASSLRRTGTALDFDTVRDLKESLCRVGGVTAAATSGAAGGSGNDAVEYELPDGSMVHVAPQWRTGAPELLFQGQGDSLALPALVAKSITMCDRDLQPDLYGSVVLAGGTTMLPGFPERMKAELGRLVAPGTPFNVVPDPQGAGGERGYNSQRKHAAWIGGSMFASLDTFKQVRITKQEWEDCDESIVHRKSF